MDEQDKAAMLDAANRESLLGDAGFEKGWIAALAYAKSRAGGAEPVGWLLDGEFYEVQQEFLFGGDGVIPNQLPLYTNPQPSPEGWKPIGVMTHKEKIQWMAMWAAKNGAQLMLEGECGFGRECVGVSVSDTYPDYEWSDDGYNRIDPNGEVWTPEDAYHKHPCVAVLGRGESAEAQLYEWLQWFDANGFVLETGDVPGLHDWIDLLMGNNRYVRMVRK